METWSLALFSRQAYWVAATQAYPWHSAITKNVIWPQRVWGRGSGNPQKWCHQLGSDVMAKNAIKQKVLMDAWALPCLLGSKSHCVPWDLLPGKYGTHTECSILCVEVPDSKMAVPSFSWSPEINLQTPRVSLSYAKISPQQWYIFAQLQII